MRKKYALAYLILLMMQMIICNYFRLGPFLLVSLLPAMVFCIPLRCGTLPTMLIAFATGLTVDFLAEGLPGINTLSIVPVAYCRLGLCKMIFGDELVERGNDFSIEKHGIVKVAFALGIADAIFLLIYIIADGGGSMPFVFNLVKFAVSLVVGILLSLVIADVSKPDSGR